ncbi:helix-turn-helix domain-containing protein [Vibrio sp. ER1A]|uniref:helix-turn-helix domain-containing protein n=1 Tax=Vibrio sp. ER1A TaxID=1517681 RepID=UPI0004DD0746|nr:helix-turn-helix domain-containing protein [Vibrio sp. ER1A]KFA97476.1 hypothetical protein HW45_08690 [Vibrio sp. ER1A]
MIPVVYSDYATSILSQLRRSGVDVHEFVSSAGLPTEYEQAEPTFLPLQAVFRLVQLKYDQLGPESGTQVVRIALREHIVPQLLCNVGSETTLEDALKQVIQALQVQLPQSDIELKLFGDHFLFSRYKAVNTEDTTFVWSEVFSLWAMIETIQALTKTDWIPTQVHLQSLCHDDIIQCFPATIQFVQARTVCGVVIEHSLAQSTITVTKSEVGFRKEEEENNGIYYNAISHIYSALRPYVLEIKFDLERAAQVINVSKRTLQRRLKEQGITFRQLRDNLILDIAMEQLQRGETVSRVAVNMGFSSIPQFSRAFKRLTGISPSRIAIRPL